MDQQRLIKTEPPACPPQPQDGYFLSHSPFQVVPSTPNGAALYPSLQAQNHLATLPVQSHQIGQPAQSPFMVVDNLQVRQPCALIVNEAGAMNPNSALSLSASELDTKTQEGYTSMHVPSSSNASGSELGRIVRPLTPTQQCRIQDNDIDHIGHMLMEVNVKDEVENGSVCALSAKTLYLSNSGAVISTIDLPYYWCNFCTFKTEQKIVLLKHTMSHRFWCKWCRYQAYNRADVIRHCISIHPQLSENDFKFCVLLPDFLHSKLVPEKKEDGYKKDDSTVNLGNSETALAACEEEGNTDAASPATTNTVSESVTNEVCEQSKKKNSGRFKKVPKKSSKRKGVDSSEKLEAAKKTKQAKETENSLANDCKPEKSFSVCFECCSCHLRTLQKEIIERHQHEENHYETDRTTGKKTYVLKIISTADKLKLHASDRKWLTEREETSIRTRRRSKVEALQFIKTKVSDEEEDDNDTEWDLGNDLEEDDDDDDDEDYVPTKGKKKSKNVWKKNSTQSGESNEKCIVSNVDIEIDTAAEPSSDTVVQSFSVSCLNVENAVKISPKKIVSRDLFDNSLIVEPHRLVPEVKQEMSHMKKVLFAGDKVRMPCVASTNPVLATLVSATTSAVSVPTASNSIRPCAIAPKSDSAVIIVSAEAPVPAVQTSVPLTASASIIIDDAPPNTRSSKAGSSNPPSKLPKPASNPSETVSKSSNSSVAPKTSSESPASSENLGLEEEAKLNETIVNRKGIFKCAHCRVVADRILQIRLHILEKHKENPLYCLDMETIDGVSPRYMLFCHFKNCKFFTRSRDNFLIHVDKCKFGKVNKLTKSEEIFKEVNYNFVKSTYPKLMKITK